MEIRAILAIVISLLILFLYQYLFLKKEQQETGKTPVAPTEEVMTNKDSETGRKIEAESFTELTTPFPQDSSKVSFESYDVAGSYIRHANYLLRIDPVNDDLGRNDATFGQLGD